MSSLQWIVLISTLFHCGILSTYDVHVFTEEPESEVSAYFNQGIMTARIAINEDVYVIEVRHYLALCMSKPIKYCNADALFGKKECRETDLVHSQPT